MMGVRRRRGDENTDIIEGEHHVTPKTAVSTPRREAEGGGPAHTWISDSSLQTGDSKCLLFMLLACGTLSRPPWQTHPLTFVEKLASPVNV